VPGRRRGAHEAPQAHAQRDPERREQPIEPARERDDPDRSMHTTRSPSRSAARRAGGGA
jgi:hypothetical protein